MANPDVFNSMMGGTGGPGTPSQAASRESSVDTTIKPKETVNPVWMEQTITPGFYRGAGGYEYIVDTQGEITIAKSPRGKAGTVVGKDSEFYDFIANELAGKAPSTPSPVAERPKTGGTTARKAAPPSARASAAEKEAYADTLLVQGPEGGTFTMEGPTIEAPAKGSYGSMGALREAEAAMPASEMAKGKAIAGADIAAGEAAKRKEIAGYAASDMSSTLKRAALSDAAKARLMTLGMPENVAAAVVRNLMIGVTDMKSHDSLRSLQALAGS
jgi:Fe2+ transport system protein FeoA